MKAIKNFCGSNTPRSFVYMVKLGKFFQLICELFPMLRYGLHLSFMIALNYEILGGYLHDKS